MDDLVVPLFQETSKMSGNKEERYRPGRTEIRDGTFMLFHFAGLNFTKRRIWNMFLVVKEGQNHPKR